MWIKLILIKLLLFISLASYGTNNNFPTAYLVNINGAIGPATADFITRGIKTAEENNAQLFIIKLDTPGGLDKSMRVIIKSILSSTVPVITYVAPGGARAASAGTFILYASPIAAMAPGTNLGAASPVSIGGGLPTPDQSKKNNKNKKSNQKSTLQKKVSNDAIAYISSLAELHGRDKQFAIDAVRNAKSISAKQALNKNVIDYIANNLEDLFSKINNKKIKLHNKTVILNTKDIKTITIQPDWRMKLLTAITDPSVAYILLLIGIYGLFFEFMNPGVVIPGVVGAIALLLALYAFQLMPINYVGLGLIILGICFMVAEIFLPSFGALGLGGIIAFIAGSILLMDDSGTGYSIPWSIIILFSIINAIFIFVILGMALSARRKPIVSGREYLIGAVGVVNQGFHESGTIRVQGEQWQAESTQPVYPGQKVKIISLTGLVCQIEPINNSKDNN